MLSALIAFPLAGWAIHHWLKDFAYWIEDDYNQQLLLLPYLVNLTSIFEKMPVSGQHVIMREVFKQGFTFKDGAFRTPSINPAFEHNLLILKEKGLLFLKQPGDVLDDLPSGTPVGINLPLAAFGPVFGFDHCVRVVGFC